MATDQLAAKLDDVTRLMDKLAADLQKINLLPHRRHTLLLARRAQIIDICRTRRTFGTSEDLWS
jgi:hypothetical protein